MTPVKWQVTDNGSGVIDRLPSHTQVALYRIVQEALNNAFRHSGAARIAVQIAASGPRASIRVQDDGKGLSIEVRRHASGIANMRTRAALIDAGFKLKSGPQGTEIRLEIDSVPDLRQRESETR